eukprot:TRINITY_DN2295_c0_g1_i1.p2 TRINITY_DN2295_c0_g1~~TRINITY_DN2295_c0_g1_i1.p2  ORF type:complete len:329 (+),score=106.59 TRINITY_DN2295_c0_g1_i1:75-989(+)
MGEVVDFGGRFGVPYAGAGSYADIKVFLRGAVATVMISRPQKLNALTDRMCYEIVDAFTKLNADPAVRVIIFTGDPRSKMHCAGADFSGGGGWVSKEEKQHKNWAARHRDGGGAAALAIGRCIKPVIGAAEGTVVGGGLTQLLACDIRYVAEGAKLAFPFVRRGILPEGTSTYNLPRVVGHARAAEWVLRGNTFTAKDAEGTGLFSRVLPRGTVYDEAAKVADDIAANCSPTSLAIAKSMLKEGAPGSAAEAHLLESRLLAWTFTQEDSREGVLSFMQKRPPRFPALGALPEPWWTEPDVRSRL